MSAANNNIEETALASRNSSPKERESNLKPRKKIKAATSQTLDRGLMILDLLQMQGDNGMSVADIAADLDIDRRIAYRLTETLSQRSLIAKGQDGKFRLSLGILRFAAAVNARLQEIAYPELRKLADDLGVTAFIIVREGNEGLTLQNIEPRGVDFVAGYKVGTRHSLENCSAGYAILSMKPPAKGEKKPVTMARELGFAIGYGREHPGAIGIASPIKATWIGVEASVGVIVFGEIDEKKFGERVKLAAKAITNSLF